MTSGGNGISCPPYSKGEKTDFKDFFHNLRMTKLMVKEDRS